MLHVLYSYLLTWFVEMSVRPSCFDATIGTLPTLSPTTVFLSNLDLNGENPGCRLDFASAARFVPRRSVKMSSNETEYTPNR